MGRIQAILRAARGVAGTVLATGAAPRGASAPGRGADDATAAAPREAAVKAAVAGLSHLPLVELPIHCQAQRRFALMLSGDGGWAAIDKGIAGALNREGIPVVGFNCLRYFWTKRTPEDTARDIQAVLEAYAAKWEKDAVMLVGYSRGADVLPFIVNRLPEALRARICLSVLLGSGQHAEFEFHLTDWFRASSRSGLPVAPELAKMKGIPLLCVYGDRETGSLCKVLPAGLAHVQRVPGAHHFGGHYERISTLILDELRAVPPPP